MATEPIGAGKDPQVRFGHDEWVLAVGMLVCRCPPYYGGKVGSRGRAIGFVCTRVVIQVPSVDELDGDGVWTEKGPGTQNRALRGKKFYTGDLEWTEVRGKPGEVVSWKPVEETLSEEERWARAVKRSQKIRTSLNLNPGPSIHVPGTAEALKVCGRKELMLKCFSNKQHRQQSFTCLFTTGHP